MSGLTPKQIAFKASEVPQKLLVPMYLMASYLYYHCDESVIPDSEYDALCMRLLNEWDEIKHRHKKLIPKDALNATTAFCVPKHKYPLIVQSASWSWLKTFQDEEPNSIGETK